MQRLRLLRRTPSGQGVVVVQQAAQARSSASQPASRTRDCAPRVPHRAEATRSAIQPPPTLLCLPLHIDSNSMGQSQCYLVVFALANSVRPRLIGGAVQERLTFDARLRESASAFGRPCAHRRSESQLSADGWICRYINARTPLCLLSLS